MFGKIRIIGGKWKGRRIPISSKSTIRPTTNYMRETLFNWLNPFIYNAVCLDCFAGSGALGLESLSRGASTVTFIDINKIYIAMLLNTMKLFHAYNNTVICGDCCIWLQQRIDKYDVIFIDPPFNSNILSVVIKLLEKHDHLKKQSWIYIETPNDKNILNFSTIPSYWFLYRNKVTRAVAYYLYLANK